MESFYGGRQGASIVIKARFKYITDKQQNNNSENSGYIDPYYKAALDALTTGESPLSEEDAKAVLAPDTMTVQLSDPHYTDVGYNEYCIIDAANKNNVNNGQIYRRTLKSTNDEDAVGSVAEYIGQIVGPTGSSPQLGDFTSVSTLQSNFTADKSSLEIDDILTYIGDNGEDGEWTTATKNSSSNLSIKTRPLVTGTNLIAGNTQVNGAYVQQGKYGWYNIRKNTSDTDTSLVYLGFDIPYYVTEFENGHALSYKQTDVQITKTINTGQTPTAPFYEKYQINVPRGVPGAGIDNLQGATTSSANQYYSLSSLTYSAPTENNNGTDSGSIPNGTSKPTIAINTSVGICDFHGFDKTGTQQNIPNLYIGKYKAINNITLDNDGTLKISYTDNPQQDIPFQNKLTGITDALVVTGREEGGNLDRYIGHLLVKFNNDTIMQDKQIGGNNNNYSKYVDLGLVKTIQEGLYVESKNYQVNVAASADINAIETAIRTLFTNSNTIAPDKTKAQIVTVTKGEEPSVTVEKAIVYGNGVNLDNGQGELLGDTVSSGGGRAEHGAILDGTGLAADDTDLVLTGYHISSSTLANYPPAFPV